MLKKKATFLDTNDFLNYIASKQKGELVVGYFDCNEYEGMVLAIMIVFDIEKSKYNLDLQWMSLGLDLYGDTLQESYVYQFISIQTLLEYLDSKYQLNVTNIPLEFEFDNNKFPNPISNKDKKLHFETAWKKFQSDFKKGLFLVPSLDLIYNSLDH